MSQQLILFSSNQFEQKNKSEFKFLQSINPTATVPVQNL